MDFTVGDEAMKPKIHHSALAVTWWVNLYPDGGFNGKLCVSKQEALDHCTYTEGKPDAVQVQVRLVEVKKRKK